MSVVEKPADNLYEISQPICGKLGHLQECS